MSENAGIGAAVAGRLAAAGIAVVATRVAYAALASRPPGGRERWERKNHRGEPVTLLAGPAVALGTAVAFALAPGLPHGARVAGVGATLGSGALGLFDDLAEPGERGQSTKGLRGHLGALRQGHLTTGAVKLAGLPLVGLLAAAPVSTGARGAVVGAGVVAGYANVVNLFDLRPGRASKVALLHAPSLARAGAGGAALAGALGAAAALLPRDLGEQVMLGDAGANALGAGIGLATLLGRDTAGRLRTLAALALLVAASEKVSFTKVIAATPPLRWADELGRRPAERA
ncbi:MAG: hypothetical protein ACT4P1_05590 [Sporichthyaceae bacterium]